MHDTDDTAITPLKICETLPEGALRDAGLTVLAKNPSVTLSEFWASTLTHIGNATAKEAANLSAEAAELRTHIKHLRQVVDENFKDHMTCVEEALLQVDTRALDLDLISKACLSNAEQIVKSKT